MTTTIDNSKKLSLKLKIGFGAASLANITWIAWVTFGMIFLTDTVGIPPALAGISFAIATFWDALTGPIIGGISDRVKFKSGRRRPFIIGIAIPFAIVSWLLFSNFGFTPTISFYYFTVIIMIFYSTFSLFDVPYSALGAEITQDYDERVSLNSFRILFTQIACVVGATFPGLLVYFFQNTFGHSESMAWSMAGAVFAALVIPGFIITWYYTKGHEIYDVNDKDHIEDKFSLVEAWKAALSNRPLKFTLGIFAFGICTITLWTAMTTYYYLSYMEMDELMLSLVYFVSGAFGVFFIPHIDYLAKKYSKKVAWIVHMAIFGITTVVGLTYVLKPGMFWLPLIFAALSAGGQMVAYQMGWSMIADCVEVDELVTGQRREGMIYGFVTLVQKSADSLMMLLAGFVLQFIGYATEGDVQTQFALDGMRYLNGYGVLLMAVISIIFAYFSPMTRERHNELCKIIQLKEEGKEYDITPIKELLK